MPALFAVISVALKVVGHFRLHQENRRRIVRDRIDIHIHAAVFAHDEDAEIIGQGGEVALRMQGIEDIEAGRCEIERQRPTALSLHRRWPHIGQGDVIEFQPVDAELVFEAENLCLIVFRGQVIYFHARTIFRRRVSINVAAGKTRAGTCAAWRHQCRASRTSLSRRPAMPRVNSSRQAAMTTMTGILSSAYVSSA